MSSYDQTIFNGVNDGETELSVSSSAESSPNKYGSREPLLAEEFLRWSDEGVVEITFGKRGLRLRYQKKCIERILFVNIERMSEVVDGLNCSINSRPTVQGGLAENVTQCLRDAGVVPRKKADRTNLSWKKPVDFVWEFSEAAFEKRQKRKEHQYAKSKAAKVTAPPPAEVGEKSKASEGTRRLRTAGSGLSKRRRVVHETARASEVVSHAWATGSMEESQLPTLQPPSTGIVIQNHWKSAHARLDVDLANQGLRREETPQDGNCFFSCLQRLEGSIFHKRSIRCIRAMLCDYLEDALCDNQRAPDLLSALPEWADGNPAAYLAWMRSDGSESPQEWADDLMVHMASWLLRGKIRKYAPGQEGPMDLVYNEAAGVDIKMLVAHVNTTGDGPPDHYESVVAITPQLQPASPGPSGPDFDFDGYETLGLDDDIQKFFA
jgi:hypothetical protein